MKHLHLFGILLTLCVLCLACGDDDEKKPGDASDTSVMADGDAHNPDDTGQAEDSSAPDDTGTQDTGEPSDTTESDISADVPSDTGTDIADDMAEDMVEDTATDVPVDTSATYTVGGSVTGLDGTTLTLSLNGSEDLTLDTDGAFTFTGELAFDASYEVTAAAHPLQICTVSGGTGSVAGHVSDVTVRCEFLVFFAGADAAGNQELWKSDGTAAGTEKVAEINPAAGVGSVPQYFAFYQGVLYFDADDGTLRGREIWAYDGTNAPTRVTDLDPSDATGGTLGHAAPRHLTVYNDLLFFDASNGAGRHLFRWDGTNAPEVVANDTTDPVQLADISSYYYLTVFGNSLYFQGGGGGDNELYRYVDGAPGTLTKIETDPTAAGAPKFPEAFDGNLFFSAGGDKGKELYRYDGTGTTVINLDGSTGDSSPAMLVAGTDALSFVADVNGPTHVWRYTTSNGPQRVAALDVITGPTFPTVSGSDLFLAGAESNQYKLWVYSGSGTPDALLQVATGTGGLPQPLRHTTHPTLRFSPIGGKVLFSFDDGTSVGRELYITDGTAAGTALLKDLCTAADCDGTAPYVQLR